MRVQSASVGRVRRTAQVVFMFEQRPLRTQLRTLRGLGKERVWGIDIPAIHWCTGHVTQPQTRRLVALVRHERRVLATQGLLLFAPPTGEDKQHENGTPGGEAVASLTSAELPSFAVASCRTTAAWVGRSETPLL